MNDPAVVNGTFYTTVPAAFAALALLAGCATNQPPKLPDVVKVPVTVPCVVDRPARPELRTPASVAADPRLTDYDKAVSLAREIERRDRYLLDLEAATAGCR